MSSRLLLPWIALGATVGFVDAQKPDTFLAKNCVRCHGERKQEGGVSLHDLGGANKFAASTARWDQVMQMLATGEKRRLGCLREWRSCSRKHPGPVAWA